MFCQKLFGTYINELCFYALLSGRLYPRHFFVNIAREVEVRAFSWKTGSKTGILNSIWLEGHIGVLKSLRAALGLKKLMRTA